MDIYELNLRAKRDGRSIEQLQSAVIEVLRTSGFVGGIRHRVYYDSNDYDYYDVMVAIDDAGKLSQLVEALESSPKFEPPVRMQITKTHSFPIATA